MVNTSQYLGLHKQKISHFLALDIVMLLINKSRSFDCINRKNNCRRGRVGKIQNNIMVYKGIDLYKHAFNTSSNIHVVFKNTTVTSGHIALSITKNKTS